MFIYYESEQSFVINDIYIYIINIVLIFYLYKKAKFLYEKYIKTLTVVEFKFLALFFLLFNVFGMYAEWRGYNDQKYLTESYDVVEGFISNHKVDISASRNESFEVDGVFFEYNNVVTPKLFFANRSNKDSIIGNGTYVKMSYIIDDGIKYIVKIEVMD